MQENPNLVEAGDLARVSPLSIVAQMTELTDVFSLGMAIEAQSLDLYTRFAARVGPPASKKLFQELADEEKAHLNYIAKEMDRHLAG